MSHSCDLLMLNNLRAPVGNIRIFIRIRIRILHVLQSADSQSADPRYTRSPTMGTSFPVHVRSHSAGHLHCQSARPGCQSRLLACCQRPSWGLASWLTGLCPPVNHVDVDVSYVTGTASQWERLAQRQKEKKTVGGVPDKIFLPFCQGSRVWQTDRRTDRQNSHRYTASALNAAR